MLGRKLTSIEMKVSSVESRLSSVEGRVDSVEKSLKSDIRRLKQYIDRRISRLGNAFSSYQEFFIEYLSMRGVLEERETTLLKGEAVRLSKLVSNPFTKEELEKLKAFLEREPGDFSLEEAYEFRELARKAIREYGEYPEAYKLHIYASIVVGIAMRKLGEKEKSKSGSSTAPE
ncbi:MAG: hypothetical protein ACP5LQ_08975 [Candidatus Methanodesulfokora sp.]